MGNQRLGNPWRNLHDLLVARIGSVRDYRSQLQ